MNYVVSDLKVSPFLRVMLPPFSEWILAHTLTILCLTLQNNY